MVQTLDAPPTLGAMTRKSILWTAAAAVAVAGAFIAGTAWSSPSAVNPVVKVNVGGLTSSVENSTNRAPGEDVYALGEAKVIVTAAGDDSVICRITVNGVPVSEATTAGKGRSAACYWKR